MCPAFFAIATSNVCCIYLFSMFIHVLLSVCMIVNTVHYLFVYSININTGTYNMHIYTHVHAQYFDTQVWRYDITTPKLISFESKWSDHPLSYVLVQEFIGLPHQLSWVSDMFLRPDIICCTKIPMLLQGVCNATYTIFIHFWILAMPGQRTSFYV